jgi:hypothetical protein
MSEESIQRVADRADQAEFLASAGRMAPDVAQLLADLLAVTCQDTQDEVDERSKGGPVKRLLRWMGWI